MYTPTQEYPITQFAAVVGVKYASSNESDIIPYFAPGAVLLSELTPGEFGLVITGHSYSVTIVAVALTETWKICTESDSLEVRLSPWRTGEQLYGQTWLYLRFQEPAVYSDFNRVLWNSFWHVQSKAQLIQARLKGIGYAQPSNFTKYCRQYLGNDYFKQVAESETQTDDEDALSGDDESRLYWSDEAQRPSSEPRVSGSDVEQLGSRRSSVNGHGTGSSIHGS